MPDADRFARSTFVPTLAFIALSLFLIHFGSFLGRQLPRWDLAGLDFGHRACEKVAVRTQVHRGHTHVRIHEHTSPRVRVQVKRELAEVHLQELRRELDRARIQLHEARIERQSVEELQRYELQLHRAKAALHFQTAPAGHLR